MTTATYPVTGMTCEHCVSAVQQEVGALAGVRAVRVDLVPGATSMVTVDSQAPLADDAVRAAVDEAGYEVADE